MLEKRAISFPIAVGPPWLARSVLAVAADLAKNDISAAKNRTKSIQWSDEDEHETTSLKRGGPEGQPNGRIVPGLRAKALAQILIDLATNGWGIVIDSGRVFVRAPGWRVDATGLTPDEVQAEKEAIRRSLHARVDEQLNRPGTRQFILAQERAHFGATGPRNVLSLLADGPALAASLRDRGAAAIQPYIQVADERKDVHTGLKLWDVFRYFRYFWSFPYYSTPGRTLPLLVRDAGQPNHPVCGLLCLSSPVPKLTARDAALGLTPAWLEAVVMTIRAFGESAERVRQALDEVDRLRDPALTRASVLSDAAALLGTGDGKEGAVLRAVFALEPRSRKQRVASALKRVLTELKVEIETAIRAIAVRDLGLTHAQALRNPKRFAARLTDLAADARESWKKSRALTNRIPSTRNRDSHEMSRGEIDDTSRDPLYLKKRAGQLRALLSAWESLLDSESATPAITRRVFGSTERANAWRLTAGERVSQGLRVALQQRLSRLMASQVADVSVCGALPPYGPLLGGKLAALAALSAEPARLYFETYKDQVSDIGSKMAGKMVKRPAELLALSTTSFFSVGSSQYNRVSVQADDASVAWEFVGQSKGHGTLHFSLETTELLHTLLQVETGRALITSRFGEGPSERLRKVRDGLVLLGLEGDEFLRHGMPRLVYLAKFERASTRLGQRTKGAPWRMRGPSLDAISDFWRTRWLAPRLARRPELVDEVSAFRRSEACLSRRLVDIGPLQSELALVSGVKT